MIDEGARRKLEKNLKKVGLLQPLVLNTRTGNLVSGHQRLAIMDRIEGGQTYDLDVATVDLDPKEEREQNVFMNNQSAMGTWDNELLEDLIKDGLDWQTAGFDRVDLESMVDLPDGVGELFRAPTEGLAKEHFDEAAQFAEEAEEARAEEREEERKKKGEEFQELRRKYREEARKNADTEFLLILVFNDREQQSEFLTHLKLPPEEKYVDGQRILDNLKAQMK